MKRRDTGILARPLAAEDYLLSEFFRAGRGQAQSGPADAWHQAWMWIQDRLDVVFNRLTDNHGRHVDLSRLAITTDAGIGKSAAVDWLTARLNQPDTGCFACKFELGTFRLSSTNFTGELLLRLASASAAPELGFISLSRLRSFVYGGAEDEAAL